MKAIFYLLIVLAIGCDRLGSGVDVQENLRILFVDTEGVNIFQKDSPDIFVEDLNLYYYNSNMVYVIWFTENLDYPNHISGPWENGILNVGPVFGEEDGTYVEGGKSTTYLDFGNGDIDTIQVSGIKDVGRSLIRDVWYNGEYMEDAILNGFTVVK